MNNDKRINKILRMGRRASEIRKKIIKRYLSNKALPRKPYYLMNDNLIGGHLIRLGECVKEGDRFSGDSYHAYNLQGISGSDIKVQGGVLAEISILIIQEILDVKGSLHIAGGFFSFMVSCIDDYIDKEDSYEVYGEKLVSLSHVYNDLVELALDRELALGSINMEQLLDIKKHLFEVGKTLAMSEDTVDPDKYLYEKSCGDKVIGVLFPASQSSVELKEKCAELGKVIGEVGQLIDDIMDIYKDLKNDNKNYLILSNSGIDQTLVVIKNKLRRGRKIADDLVSEPAMWVLDLLDDIINAFERQNDQNKKITPELLLSSMPLPFLNAGGTQGLDLLLWF